MGGAFYYTMRLATRNPDVTWSHHDNPEPWQHYSDKQYKVNKTWVLSIELDLIKSFRLQFYSPVRDYSKTESQAPKF